MSSHIACAHHIVEINTETAVCPQPNQTLWNAHPRVYFTVEKGETVSCPYCGTHYQYPHDAT